MLQTVCTPTNASIMIAIPDEYIGKKLEITVSPMQDESVKKHIAQHEYMSIEEFRTESKASLIKILNENGIY
ncbi:MAG: hypothetical protein LBV75_06605 [Paludibacter sp.]|jgi:hypothetical protein|nr:hypothetical protein [Paludibacter sp.]